MKRRNFFGAIGGAVAAAFGFRTTEPCASEPSTCEPMDVTIRTGLLPGDRCSGRIYYPVGHTDRVVVQVYDWHDAQDCFVPSSRWILVDVPGWYDGYPGSLHGKRCSCYFGPRERWIIDDIEVPPLTDEERRILYGDPQAPKPQGVLYATKRRKRHETP